MLNFKFNIECYPKMIGFTKFMIAYYAYIVYMIFRI